LQLKKKLLKNTAYNYFFRIWMWFVTFLLFPFVVHHLGLAAVGIVLLVNSFVGYMGVLNLGIGPSLTKYVAQYRVENDFEKLNKSISTSFVILYPYPKSRQKLQAFKVDSSPYVKAVGTEGARRATGVPTATPYTSTGVR
jgi:hypothetical protein